MTIEPDEISDFFEKHNDEFLKFDRVENKLHTRPDIHAFILLDQLVPDKGDMVAGASHDEIYLDTTPEDAFKAATEAQLIDLIRCGVRYSDDIFCMFV